ncbi:MAG: epoxyqueuosine reductase QueH, partial [Spirochaetes bacterium]|nr:epoxyqueuosine reductase QueH [Spirochaetota bacterium]
MQGIKLILLHTCCAPCGLSAIERLLHEKNEVTIFFSNSNIFPEEEFQKRLYYAEKLANFYNVALIRGIYDYEAWKKRVLGCGTDAAGGGAATRTQCLGAPQNMESTRKASADLENEPERGKRCSACFGFNLERTAEKARELAIPFFTTSLTVSPHKDSAQIFGVGRNLPVFSAKRALPSATSSPQGWEGSPPVFPAKRALASAKSSPQGWEGSPPVFP